MKKKSAYPAFSLIFILLISILSGAPYQSGITGYELLNLQTVQNEIREEGHPVLFQTKILSKIVVKQEIKKIPGGFSYYHASPFLKAIYSTILWIPYHSKSFSIVLNCLFQFYFFF